MINRYYTLPEAAEIMRVSVSTLRRWIKAKKLPYKKAGKRYLIMDIDIPTFLRNNHE